MDTEYGKLYRDLYERHWWWRSRESAVLGVIRRRLSTSGRRNILDVGCGDGLFFRALEEFGNVEGVEASAELVSHDNPYCDRIHTAPFDRRFIPGKSFDLILMLDVLEHLSDPLGALSHAASLLLPGGYILITVPALRLLWTNHDVINHHQTRYRKATLRPLLLEAGFIPLEERYWYQWACPVKLAQRAVEKAFHLPPSLPSVPPAWLNACLYSLSRAECKTLGSWGVPFGSTLMVFGRKEGS